MTNKEMGTGVNGLGHHYQQICDNGALLALNMAMWSGRRYKEDRIQHCLR